jgi:hypothetical protein
MNSVIHRRDFGLHSLVPAAAFALAWWMGRGVFVAIGTAVAAAIVTAILRPRRPGRWTE